MKKRETIIIADDLELNREILRGIFQASHPVVTVSDGESVICLLEEAEQEISMILLDLMMPRKSGFEVLEYMKEHDLLKEIPVIIITSSRQVEDELRAYSMGCAELIHKPFTPQIVLRRAENLMELYESRRAVMEQLEASKKRDPLTGLLNRQEFLLEAGQRLDASRAAVPERSRTLIYYNIRDFKYFNFKYGMEEGNLVLRRLADWIRRSSPDALNARFGNDHFVTLTDDAHFYDAVNEIRTRFDQEFGHIGVKLKAGIFRIRQGEDALVGCDLAKVACDSIRDRQEYYCEYDEKLEHRVEMQAFVMQNIDEAIRKKHIQVYYQPVIRTISGGVCGVEALARWIDPKKGFLSPGDFIPALEEKRQITKLDLYMLSEICSHIKEAEAEGRAVVPVSFNLSRIDFMEGDIFDLIEEIIADHGVSRELINIEVTESIVMDDPSVVRQIITRFRDGGYQIWMDDFGSGYSSLNVLKDFQFDEVKLDMAFLSTFDETSKKIVKAIVSMAKDIGIQTLAEGVESREQFLYLREIGCEKVQGYYFSRPIPKQELWNYVDEHLTETMEWKQYFNSMGCLNFLTERPLAIAEYDGSTYHTLYSNQAFQDGWNRILGLDSIEPKEITRRLDEQFHKLQPKLHTGMSAIDLVEAVDQRYISLHVQCISEYKNHAAYAVELTNLTNYHEYRDLPQI